MRYEWIDRNPIKLVRQSAKREKVPEVLELSELQLLLSKLFVRERTLALLDAATGLRVSELLALRWSDVDFENLELRVTRIDLASGCGQLQDGSIGQACPDGQLHGGGSASVATPK